MKTLLLPVGLLLAFAATLALAETGSDAKEQPPTMLRHIVLFKFKKETSETKIDEIEKAFVGLADKIDTVSDLEWGTNVSPENLDKGFTHCFLVNFEDANGRTVYLTHEAHTKFVSLLRPHLEEALVIDYKPEGK